MYADNEIKISRKYLEEVIRGIDEPVVVIGGWAVYFTVNSGYRETTGREYLGSRDIDLGFEIPDDDLKNCAFAKAIWILENKLGFKPLSFRFFKEIHFETGVELDDDAARRTPSHNIFPMYVDLIVDRIPDRFTSVFGFTPPDEPLLAVPFRDPAHRFDTKEFGRTIWCPDAEVLLATKIRSFSEREKEHKRIKDACDISALLLFTTGCSKEGLESMIGPESIKKFKMVLSDENVKEASQILDVDHDLITSALEKVLGIRLF